MPRLLRMIPTAALRSPVRCCLLVALLGLWSSTASGQITLRIEPETPFVAPGQSIAVDVFIDNPAGVPVGGYQVGLTFPTDRYFVETLPAPLSDSVLTAFFSSNAPLPAGTGYMDCSLWDDGLGLDVTTAVGIADMGSFTGTSGHLFRFTLGNTAQAGDQGIEDTIDFNQFQVFCLSWQGSFAVDPSGGILATSFESSMLTISEVPPVTSLNCAIDPQNATTVNLTWSNGLASYDSVIIRRSDLTAPLTSLVGTDQNFTDTAFPGNVQYSVAGVLGGVEAPYANCAPFVPVIIAQPTGLTCVPNNGDADLAWTNGETYTSIEVYRDGALLGVLPGIDTSFTDVGVGTTGTVTYEVVGAIGSDTSPATECIASLDPILFTRGDVNNDGAINVGDAPAALNYLFNSEPVDCIEAVDVDDDAITAINDAVLLLAFLFQSGAPPQPPFPNPGVDPTPDALGCL